ncbi:TraG/TraD/VirD4 family protein [Acinetobacter baumannii]|nr:TraG/TraD/VirD4 family protein [Acinetobacter baumannii]
MSFLGLQDIPQLEEKYGEKIARSIISALQTKVFYRVNENETAKRMSEILGQMEVAEKICLEVWGLMIQETVIVLLLKGENALLFYHLKL